jgi:hypothetical protein
MRCVVAIDCDRCDDTYTFNLKRFMGQIERPCSECGGFYCDCGVKALAKANREKAIKNDITESDLRQLKFIKENNGQIFQISEASKILLKKNLIRTDSGGYLRITTNGDEALISIGTINK